MACVYSGAFVYFEDYSAAAYADIFECEGAILIRSGQLTYHPAEHTIQRATHRVTETRGHSWSIKSGDPSAGRVVLVPRANVKGEFR